ncbi:MAG: TerC/Alx family metal homeostasis membrane protein [Saprospiraceae bacterium]
MSWILFLTLVILLLSIDLLVLHKKGTTINNKKAAVETIFWISVALLFSGAVFWIYQNDKIANINALSPTDAAIKYITGYLIELSLSVDNLFVIAMVFASYKIPLAYQHRALFWGIIGAIVFRGLAIWGGAILIQKVSWMTYIFGAFLLFTAFKMLENTDEEESESKLTKKINQWFNISKELDGEKFFTLKNGKKVATPLFAALMVIELSDILFALDSIPAILAVTTDPFLVFSSNIFAILGLRSMYFFLANMLEKFHYLKYSVFAILLFVSIKLLSIHFVHFPEWFSLLFIGIALLMGVIVSLEKMTKNHSSSNV